MNGSTPAPRSAARPLKLIGLTALVVVTLVSFAPMIGLAASMAVANALGCQVDEGSVHPCRVHGLEIGSTLNAGFVLAWMMFVTWPGMLISLGLWMWVIVRMGWRWVRARRAVSP